MTEPPRTPEKNSLTSARWRRSSRFSPISFCAAAIASETICPRSSLSMRLRSPSSSAMAVSRDFDDFALSLRADLMLHFRGAFGRFADHFRGAGLRFGDDAVGFFFSVGARICCDAGIFQTRGNRHRGVFPARPAGA